MKLFFKIILAMFIALFAWELILENTMINAPGSRVHPVIGRVTKPGPHMQGTEGYAKTTINSFGMRGPEIAAKTQGEYRIVALGDSFTLALAMHDHQTYTQLLQEDLKNRGKSSTIVINGGIGGFSPAYHLKLAEYYHRTFQPDYVIVQMNETDFTTEIFDAKKNFYVANENGNFVVKASESRGSNKDKFIKKYPQMAFIDDLSALATVQIGGKTLERVVKKHRTKDPSPLGSDTSPIVDWTVTRLKEAYPNLVILFIPQEIDFFKNPQEQSVVEIQIQNAAKQQDIPFITMRPAFADHYQKTYQIAYGFNNTQPGVGHTNDVGNRLMARELASFFQREVLK